MSEENKLIARRFIEAFQGGDEAALRAVLAEDVVDHNPSGPDSGIKGVLGDVQTFKGGFPDLRLTIDRQIAEGDFVAHHGIATGTNTGSLLGAPPTNKTATIAWMDVYRIEGGKIREMWHLEDIAGLLRQLGMA
jgi:steroid delta-isomerase-like uncharacterized protein